MTHVEDLVELDVDANYRQYLLSANADIRMLLSHYTMEDIGQRVVGISGVGTPLLPGAFPRHGRWGADPPGQAGPAQRT